MPTKRQIALFTDFGAAGPYLGQMESVLRRIAPDAAVIHLLSDAPKGEPQWAAYLLAALRHGFPADCIFLAVVDPGVGGARRAVVVQADGQYFVGPDNGLFNTVAVHARHCQWQEIIYLPEQCSASFHGRDLFAPVAAQLALGAAEGLLKPAAAPDLRDWRTDLPAIIYGDHYGNAMTGLRYRPEMDGCRLSVAGKPLSQAGTFCEVPPGTAFWYCNSIGLVEIAVNRGSAMRDLGVRLGDAVGWC